MINWAQHLALVEAEIELYWFMLDLGRIPANPSQLCRLERDRRHCETMLRVRGRK